VNEHLDRSLKQATAQLDNALEAWNVVETTLLPAAAQGLNVPDLGQKIQRGQIDLAEALDQVFMLVNTVETAEERQEPAFEEAMQKLSMGMMNYNAFTVGILLGRQRILGKAESQFKSTLLVAYKLQEDAHRKMTAASEKEG
jgi:hypothetical protein